MSTFKKLLALTLALAMVLSVSAFAGSYKADTYKDAAGIDEDCEDAIELMYALDIMKGDANGNFNPTATIKRAEIAKMIYVILNYGKDDKAVNYTGAKIFSDVPAGAWYEGYVNYCGTTKLVQGRGNGTFGPNDPITCAEAAKMLLTAIGYAAEDRGYTGANWDKNVLADAAIIGLLDGYNYSTTTYAPRQWVAVMFENALFAYTYGTVRPVSYSGLLTSNFVGNYADAYLTMGQKYYKLAQFTGYLYATDSAYIDRVVIERNSKDVATAWLEPKGEHKGYLAHSGMALFSNGKDNSDNVNNWLEIETDAVGVYDLGQQFRVIYNYKTEDVYSISATGKSDVAEDMVKDITGEIVHKNYDNDEANRYEFTVGEFNGKFNSSSINVAEFWSNGDFHWNQYGVGTVYEGLGQIVKTDMVKVIDRDGDGDIEYALYTAFDYGKVTTVKEQKYHGDYIVITKLGKDEAVKYDGDSKLYLDEVVITEDELTKGDFVKYSWNYDEGCYNVEVLPVDVATYDYKSSRTGVYTFGGEDYRVADNGIAERELEGKRKTVEYNIVADDNLLVSVFADDDSMSLEDLNGKLALLIGLTTRYDTGFYSDTNAIRFLTIEGGDEYIDAPYYMDVDEDPDEEGPSAMTWNELVIAFAQDPANFKEADLTNYNKLSGGQAQLYILHTLSSGKVWLEKLDDGQVIDNTADDLVYDLTNYESAAKLDIGEATIGAKDVAVENTFFVGIEDDGDIEYKVMTLEELGDVTAGLLHSEFILDDGVIDEVLGGYALINGTKLNGDSASGYAWIASEIKTGGYYNNKLYCDLLTPDDVLEGVRVKKATDNTILEEGGLYYYEYDLDNEYYVLTAVVFDAANDYDDNFDAKGNYSEIAKITSTKLVYESYLSTGTGADSDYFSKNVEDYPIALYVELHERNTNNEPYNVETFILWTTIGKLADGEVTIKTREIGDVAVKVVNGANIEDTFTVKSDSKMIHTEDEELVLIRVKIEEVTKQ